MDGDGSKTYVDYQDGGHPVPDHVRSQKSTGRTSNQIDKGVIFTEDKGGLYSVLILDLTICCYTSPTPAPCCHDTSPQKASIRRGVFTLGS